MSQIHGHNKAPKSSIRRLHIRREELKFSSAHMTVFPDGTKEALHGHNYVTDVTFDLSSTDLAQMVPFSSFRAAISAICREWDEKVLLPKNCPYLEVKSETDQEIEFFLSKKRYVLPREEVLLLPIDNIASEALAELFCSRLLEFFKTQPFFSVLQGLHVKIEESRGQGSSFSILL
jgi:6-pyruvoyltetrahydropterin/6-carboxytetrahydropterin synthase